MQMAMHPVHFHWPDPHPARVWRGLAALRPAVLALLLLLLLTWVAGRMTQALDDAGWALAAQPNLGDAIISGVNVALIGIMLVIVLCGMYSAAGWAIGALIQGVVGIWAIHPRSRGGWIVELAVLAAIWGLLFYALHSGILIRHVPSGIEQMLVWFGLPGLAYAWASVLRQGHVI